MVRGKDKGLDTSKHRRTSDREGEAAIQELIDQSFANWRQMNRGIKAAIKRLQAEGADEDDRRMMESVSALMMTYAIDLDAPFTCVIKRSADERPYGMVFALALDDSAQQSPERLAALEIFYDGVREALNQYKARVRKQVPSAHREAVLLCAVEQVHARRR